MDEPRECPGCGAGLGSDAPEGLCPACLLKQGMAGSGASAEPAGGSPHGSGFVPPTPEELAPDFPQFAIVELLGHGGMGAVYKARQLGLERMVALKIIRPEAADDPAFAERFAREARAMARLNHPNIVAVYDFGMAGGLYYLAMEYVDGANLQQVIRAGDLEPREALAMVSQVCDALQFAHDEGVVHRDIKPANILLDKRGRVKIADFGLAKMLGKGPTDFTLTMAGQAMGTPDYMAPEQREHAGTVDHRADIYSLGVVFYEMLTGELPIGRFAPPSKKVQVDVRLDEVVLHTLEKEPELRYQQISEVKTEVDAISSGPPPAAPVAAGDVKSVRRRLRIPAIGLFIAGGLNLLFPAYIVVFTATPQSISADGASTPGVWGLSTLVPLGLVMLALPILLIVAAARMLALRTYSLAITGAIVAMIPYGPGALVGIPMGIWALVVLSKSEVRAAFGTGARKRDRAEPSRYDKQVPAQDRLEAGVRPDADVPAARRQVRGPAIGLLIVGILNCLPAIVLIAASVVGLVAGFDVPPAGTPDSFEIAPHVWVDFPVWNLLVCSALLASVTSVFIIPGAARMWQLRSYRLAKVAAVLAMLPLTPHFVIGLPIGIWAFMVLRQPDVVAAFAAMQGQTRSPPPSAPPDGGQGPAQDQPAGNVETDVEAVAEEPGPAEIREP